MVEHALERLGNDAAVVGLHGKIARLIGVERLNGAEIRRVFEDDVIAGIDEDLSDQIEALLRAVDDEDAVGAKGAVEAAREPLRNPRAHLGDAFGNAVLQRRRAVFVHHVARRVGDFGRGKQLGRRQSAAERNHVGLLRDLEHLANRRGPQTCRSFREARGPGHGGHTTGEY